MKWEESSKRATAPFKEETTTCTVPIDLPINIHTHKIKTKKIKMVYTKIQRVKNVETFNLKSSTDDASLINYYQEGDYSIPRLFS